MLSQLPISLPNCHIVLSWQSSLLPHFPLTVCFFLNSEHRWDMYYQCFEPVFALHLTFSSASRRTQVVHVLPVFSKPSWQPSLPRCRHNLNLFPFRIDARPLGIIAV